VYPNPDVADFISRNFVPVKIHVKEQPAAMERFGVLWTPTVIILDPDGTERHKFEGYLAPDEFRAQVLLGLGHSALARKQFDVAERHFREVVDKLGSTDAAAEAQYWAGVARYKASNDPAALKETAKAFSQRYADSVWAQKASVWA
jgi:TolA-binding protein